MVDQPVKYVVEEVNSAYMSYLAQLEERNRQKQLIHQKSQELLRRERLEQGFQLYFNILNANRNLNQKIKQTNTNFNPYRSRSANLSDRHEFQRTKSAPNLPKQRRIRKAWGEFNGFDLGSNQKTSTKSHMTTDPSTESISNNSCGPKLPSSQFPYPSTKNMHCRQRRLQNDPTSEEIVCFDKDESSVCEVKETCTNAVDMTEIFGLQVDIFSNWGDKNWVGLSGLELDDSNLAKIIHFRVVEVSTLNLDGIQMRPVQLFHEENLFKEPFETSDPKHMCFTSVDNLPLRIHIKCSMNSDDRIIQDSIILRLWNYNDPKFPGIGVKDCIIKLESNNHIHILFNGVLDRISEDKLIDTPKVLDCTLKNITTLSKTSSPRKSLELLQDILDRQLTISPDPVKMWSYNSELKNWRYLRKVDPFLNDNEDELPSSCLPLNTDEPRKISKSRIRSLLEESWNSLKFFNHFHAGRINSEREHSIKLSSPVRKDSRLESDEVPIGFCNLTKLVQDDYVAKPESKEVKPVMTPIQPKINLTEMKKPNRIVCPERFYEPITIPVLPFGYTLVLDIVSTWGDIYYVGLTGIDIFTMDGINIAPFCQICADPADINILPGYSDDPRVVSNLIDGVNWTRDDIHMWLAPFSIGARHLIQIQLPSWTKPIALLRIWNYNKSRVHASRGAREILIYLDSNPIFRGEISKALGLEFGEPEDFSETILFCTDNDILERIGKNDDVLKARNLMLHDIESVTSYLDERPKTSVQQDGKQSADGNSSEWINSNGLIAKWFSDLDLQEKQLSREFWIEIELLKPWNKNTSFIGLTGIQILDSAMEQAKVSHVTIDGKSTSSEDPVQKLFSERFHTCSPDDMWCTEFIELKPPKLRIYVQFNSNSSDLDFTSLKIWNYNDPHIDTDYGCKLIRIRDHKGRIWTQNPNLDVVLLRRGPGHTRFSFGQTIQLDNNKSAKCLPSDVSESDQNCHLPSGFVYQLNLFSSWYDQFYVGLDGLELIGLDGLPIKIGKDQIFASPGSVNELNVNPNRSDIRTVDKLVDGINQGLEMNHHCWLAPILPNRINQIFIVFDEPVSAIGLRLWNYTRTPERGVRELAVLLDDRLLFRGYLPKYRNKIQHDESFSNRTVQGILPNCEQRHDNDRSNQYYVIPLSQEDVDKFEDCKYILDSSKMPLPEDGVKLINIDSVKPRDWLGTTESYLRLRSNINQTLRPTTCISNQPIITTI